MPIHLTHLSEEDVRREYEPLNDSELKERMKGHHTQMQKAFEQAGTSRDLSKVKVFADAQTREAVREKMQKVNDEMNVIGAILDERRELDAMKRTADLPVPQEQPNQAPVSNDDPGVMVVPNLAAEIFSSEGYRRCHEDGTLGSRAGSFAVTIKHGAKALLSGMDRVQNALFQVGSAAAAATYQLVLPSQRLALQATNPPTLLEALPMVTTGGPTTYTYTVETNTPEANVKGQGVASDQATMRADHTNQVLDKVITYLPVSAELMRSAPAAMDLVNMRLPQLVRAAAGAQVMTDVAAFASTATRTPDTAALTVIEALASVMGKVHGAAKSFPNLCVVNGAAWATLMSAKTTQGAPLLSANTADAQTRILGMQLIVDANAANNTATLIATDHVAVATAGDVQVDIGLNDDDFAKAQMSVRALVWVHAVNFRTGSVGQVTALGT